MCENCDSAICYEGCPFLQETLARAVCESCGEPILDDDRYYRHGSHCVCEDCADGLTSEELLAYANLSDMGELLGLLGFRYC